ncbi:MAG: hypothetical protein HY606_15280 [Planctomycetes bacterium]|nr:hypothetical protein [Planctomycetota bacterium]
MKKMIKLSGFIGIISVFTAFSLYQEDGKGKDWDKKKPPSSQLEKFFKNLSGNWNGKSQYTQHGYTAESESKLKINSMLKSYWYDVSTTDTSQYMTHESTIRIGLNTLTDKHEAHYFGQDGIYAFYKLEFSKDGNIIQLIPLADETGIAYKGEIKKAAGNTLTISWANKQSLSEDFKIFYTANLSKQKDNAKK